MHSHGDRKVSFPEHRAQSMAFKPHENGIGIAVKSLVSIV
jgi:hypothetical protein